MSISAELQQLVLKQQDTRLKQIRYYQLANLQFRHMVVLFQWFGVLCEQAVRYPEEVQADGAIDFTAWAQKVLRDNSGFHGLTF
jgi:hypothetical protein